MNPPPKSTSSKPAITANFLVKALIEPKQPEDKLDPIVNAKALINSIVDPSSHVKTSSVPSLTEIKDILKGDDKTANAVHRVVDGLVSKGAGVAGELLQAPLLKNSLERILGESNLVTLTSIVDTALITNELYKQKGMEGIKELAIDIANFLVEQLPSKQDVLASARSGAEQAAVAAVTTASLSAQIAQVLVQSIGKEIYQQLPSKAQAISSVSEFTKAAASYASERTYNAASQA